jgi:hypothetical protein
VGQDVVCTASVTDTSDPAPTGSVQFVVDGSNSGSPVPLTSESSSSATAQSSAISGLTVDGSPHSVSANYINSDGNFADSSSGLSGGVAVLDSSAGNNGGSGNGGLPLGQTPELDSLLLFASGASGLLSFAALRRRRHSRRLRQ